MKSLLTFSFLILLAAGCQKSQVHPTTAPSTGIANGLISSWKLTATTDPSWAAANDVHYSFASESAGSVIKGSATYLTFTITEATNSSFILNYATPGQPSSISTPMPYDYDLESGHLTLTSTITGFTYQFVSE